MTVGYFSYNNAGQLVTPHGSIGGDGLGLNNQVIDLSAQNSDSYGGTGQTWTNLVASPADGSTTANSSFYLGNTSGSEIFDPSFSGTAGTTNGLFSVDGNDNFSSVGGVTDIPLFRDMHKTTGGTAATIGIHFKTGASLATTYIFSTKNGVFNNGVAFMLLSDGSIRIYQSSFTQIAPTSTITTSTVHKLAITWDANFANYTTYVDSSTAVQTGSLSGVQTANADGAYNIGALNPTGGDKLASGGEYYNFFAAQENANSTYISTLFSAWDTRIGV